MIMDNNTLLLILHHCMVGVDPFSDEPTIVLDNNKLNAWLIKNNFQEELADIYVLLNDQPYNFVFMYPLKPGKIKDFHNYPMGEENIQN
jgi:hypothetical protein